MTRSETPSIQTRLARTAQCGKCPWKTSTNPRDIPNGYCPSKHAALRSTIAEPGAIGFGDLVIMACHDSPLGAEGPCIGWLTHQLGRGNNIALRLWARHVDNLGDVRTSGAQHQRFEDTLPTASRRNDDRHLPVTTLEDLIALDNRDVVEGHMGAERGDPEPGGNHSRAYHHGWRTRMMDLHELPITLEHRALTSAFVAWQRTNAR